MLGCIAVVGEGSARSSPPGAIVAARAIALAAPAAVILLACATPASARTRVLDVGDSHTWLAGAYPRSWEVDARPGRESTEGVSVVDARLRSRHREVVFDLGTNDRGQVPIFRANLAAVWERIGEHRDLTLVTSFCWGDPSSTASVNAAIEAFADRRPGRVEVAEWDDLAARHPEWNGDGVHFTSIGYEARKLLIRQAVHEGRFKAGRDVSD